MPAAAVELSGDGPDARSAASSGISGPAFKENLASPLNSMKIIRLYRAELTPASNKMYGHALLSIVKPGCSSNFMDESDAKTTLKYVAGKVETRAAKRKAEAAAAEAAREARDMEMGAKRAAKRAAIATRPVPTVYYVDNSLRPHTY